MYDSQHMYSEDRCREMKKCQGVALQCGQMLSSPCAALRCKVSNTVQED